MSLDIRPGTDPLDAYLAFDTAAPQRGSIPADASIESAFDGAADGTHDRIAASVRALRPELVALATDLYENPEIGFQEVYSSGRIADLLDAHGIDVQRGAFGLDTAFRATVGEGDAHFAIIAEYDALPEVGHACGHNIIAGQAVGAFLAARDHLAPGGGRLSIIGTPAEEGGAGKELIIRAGGFDDVDAAAMVHPGGGTSVSPVYGGGTSGVRRVRVTYRGRAAHAALSPYLGLNALDAVVTAYQGVAQLRQHILPVDRIHGIITDGGAAANVVPERAAAEFLIRSTEVATLNALTQRVVDILEAAALSTGTTAELDVDFEPPYLPLRPNVELNKRWATALTRQGRSVPVRPAVVRQGGPSTDMGNVSQFIPAIHPALGLGAASDVLPHNAAFADATVRPPAFDTLVDGAIGLAATALDYLADEGLQAAVSAEFVATGGRYRWGDG
ncbi:M20 family metallopeptidase [Microbacterium oxydans]|uniref:M20 family metallopeptidase n=1 Tax=Microbacterium TaxID=33882 RepID=UPI000DE4312E|nr:MULTISPECIES: M20 family metallopeptidase [unclassified Microbacterium]MBE7955525.1 M20 family metallopeptidase [Microbacterium sp. R1]NYF29084.1 amidohydrolase [Microbacterium sp. JAI119]RBO73382.1 M20 family peptidase [Microbacterium sp. H6]